MRNGQGGGGGPVWLWLVVVAAALAAGGCQTGSRPGGAELPAWVRAAPVGSDPEPYESEADREVLRRLEQVVQGPGRELTLREAAAAVGQALGVLVTVEWAELGEARMTPETKVQLPGGQVSGRRLLQALVRQASAAGEEGEPATWDVLEGQVVVSRVRALKARSAVLRCYDVRYLLAPTPDRSKPPIFFGCTGHLAAATQPGGGVFAPAMQPVSADMTREEMVRWVQEIIMDTVGMPDDWVERGGVVASMKELNGDLIVKAPRPYHAQLRELLAELRAQQVRTFGRMLAHTEVMARLGEAERLRLQGRHAEALQRAREALAADPEHPVARAMEKVVAETLRRRGELGR